VFETQEEREVAKVTWDVIAREFERKIKTGIEKLETPEIQAEITRIVKEVMAPEQGTFETFERKTDVAATVAKVTKQLVMNTISIPEIVVLPTSEVNFGFKDFIFRISKQSPSSRCPTRSWCSDCGTSLALSLRAPSKA
jgi:type III restriction enzyme